MNDHCENRGGSLRQCRDGGSKLALECYICAILTISSTGCLSPTARQSSRKVPECAMERADAARRESRPKLNPTRFTFLYLVWLKTLGGIYLILPEKGVLRIFIYLRLVPYVLGAVGVSV